MIQRHEILQTIQMIDQQHLDIRTITMGISLRNCADRDPAAACRRIYDKVCACAERLVPVGEAITLAMRTAVPWTTHKETTR